MGTLTSRSRELADLLKRRRVDVACIQETKWSGAKSRDIEDGYKLLYNGATRTRNGVGIAVSETLRSNIVGVERTSDRLISIKLDTGKQVLRVIAAYAPQVGCKDDEKDTFWQELDDHISSIPQEETLLLGADLNGHVGERREGGKRHGGHGYGT